MFITPHTSVAIWISTRVGDPLLAFVFGVVSHFILDIIPHGDDNIADHKKEKKEKLIYLMRIAFVDVFLACLLLYFFISSGSPVDYWVLFGAVLGAWLPDFAWITIEMLKLHTLYWYVFYHGKLHNFFNWQYSPVYGVPFQIFFTLLMLRFSL
ncbi:MAG: hypothetical protein PHO91_04220 [Patescibacteria group bacterium]|nr:hypothetical protein [Patescibacteria group bacterium]